MCQDMTGFNYNVVLGGLEVDAASFVFPVAVTGRFRPIAAAEFTGLRVRWGLLGRVAGSRLVGARRRSRRILDWHCGGRNFIKLFTGFWHAR